MTIFQLVSTGLFLSIASGNAVVYRERGHSITLAVDKPNVHNVQWIHNTVVVAHSYDGEPPECLHDNMDLDRKTFSLTMTNLQLNATGSYEFKADGLDTALVYKIVVCDPVLKHKITKQCNSSSCTLNCTGVNDENAQYTWTDNKGGKESGPVWVVERREHLDVIYTCNSSNPVSWKTNSISQREMFPNYSPLASIGREHFMICFTLALILVLVLSLLIWSRRFQNDSQQERTQIDGGGHSIAMTV